MASSIARSTPPSLFTGAETRVKEKGVVLMGASLLQYTSHFSYSYKSAKRLILTLTGIETICR